MTHQLYWHAPLWQVAAVSAATVAVVSWLTWRALRRPDVRTALTALDPALDHQPLFYFDGVRGVRPLNGAAAALITATRPISDVAADPAQPDGPRSDSPLLETLLEAYEGARAARREGWPAAGQTLIAVPVAGTGDVVTGVVAVVSREGLAPPVMPAEGAAGGWDAWQAVGPALRLHRARPAVRVSRSADAGEGGGPSAWRDEALSPNEDRLLRHLLEHRGEVQPAEALFGLVWPDEEVDRLGLRPDQRDRLRRLVFQLRQRVEPDPGHPEYVCTAHGVGYVVYGEREPEA